MYCGRCREDRNTQGSFCYRCGTRLTERSEQELKEAGILRQEGNTVHKGKGYEAQYSLTPSLTFSEQDAGRQIGGLMQAIPFLNKLVGAAEHVKLKQAQAALLLTDNETTEQVAAATGSVRVTDLGMGGLVLGKLGGAAGAGAAGALASGNIGSAAGVRAAAAGGTSAGAAAASGAGFPAAAGLATFGLATRGITEWTTTL